MSYPPNVETNEDQFLFDANQTPHRDKNVNHQLMNLVAARVKMRDGTQSKPQWFLHSKGNYYPLKNALTGPPLPQSGVQTIDKAEVTINSRNTLGFQDIPADSVEIDFYLGQ